MPSLHGPCLALDLRLGKTRSMLEVMLRTEALVNFALDHFSRRCDYDHDSVAKCPYCRAWPILKLARNDAAADTSRKEGAAVEAKSARRP